MLRRDLNPLSNKFSYIDRQKNSFKVCVGSRTKNWFLIFFHLRLENGWWLAKVRKDGIFEIMIKWWFQGLDPSRTSRCLFNCVVEVFSVYMWQWKLAAVKSAAWQSPAAGNFCFTADIPVKIFDINEPSGGRRLGVRSGFMPPWNSYFS